MRRREVIELVLLGTLGAVFGWFYVNRNRVALAINDYAGKYWPLPDAGKPYVGLLQQASKDKGIPFDLLARQIQAESSWNPDITSGKGAVGLMQLVPRWYPGFSVEQLKDPQTNIEQGSASLARYYDQFGTWAEALAAYNWGPSNEVADLRNFGAQWLYHAPLETREYVGKILKSVKVENMPSGAIVDGQVIA